MPTPEETLAAARAALGKPDPNATSAHLEQLRDDLDIPRSQALFSELAGKRAMLLLTASTEVIQRIEREIRGASLDIDMRKALSTALAALVTDARAREAKAEIDREGVEQSERQLGLCTKYYALDATLLRAVELLGEIAAGEAAMVEANLRFRQANRADLLKGLPMDELSRLTGREGQWLPSIAKFRLHGYMAGPNATAGNVDDQVIDPQWRFGRFAELLPGYVPPPKPKVAAAPSDVPAEKVAA